MRNLPKTTAYKCADSGEIQPETAGVPLYECGECGTKFSKNNGKGAGHMCPECPNKMGTRVADDCCIECEASEVEEVETVQCPLCVEGTEYELSDASDSEFGSHLQEVHGDELVEFWLNHND